MLPIHEYLNLMSERILVAVDLSEASIAALREAHALATARGASLAVVHVAPHFVDMQTLFPQNYATNLAGLGGAEQAVSAEIERQLAALDADPEVPLFIDRGEAYAEIVRRAEAWSATLIIVGSHGKTGLTRALLGSVAERVVRYAHCPVLVTRLGGAQKVVVAATDLSDPSLPAVERGAREAALRGSRLIVVHAIDSTAAAYLAAAGAPFGTGITLPPLEVQKARREALTDLIQQAITRFGATGDAVLLEGGTVPSVVRTVEEFHAELLVVGTQGRTGLSRIALGSVAEQLVRLASCSVLAVRTHPS